ncbi:hypothetical protein [Spongiivirga citrea]|uniref:Uncharacterized protein n=1 Tax=Spongiivirga citrea TaxID=1481457 RepID=A0A6M0CDZ3_9FLAO|nr:hypothetical protein [Spongiivirga citrea]NER16036.1 hypothetical protein [Spongiivirga citrea]
MKAKLSKLEIFGFSFLLIVFVLGLYFGFTDENYFNSVFTVEDGLVEYLTALMLIGISVLCLYRLFTLAKNKKAFWIIGTALFAILFIFGAGEEISWGQRIFGVESSEFFKENNAQGETNLHNMVVGGKKVNKLIFSQLLTLILVIYLIICPVLYRKANWFKDLANRFAVPIPKWPHTIAFLISTAAVLSIPSDRKWEVYELAFGVIFLLIFINPLNLGVFTKNSK